MLAVRRKRTRDADRRCENESVEAQRKQDWPHCADRARSRSHEVAIKVKSHFASHSHCGSNAARPSANASDRPSRMPPVDTRRGFSAAPHCPLVAVATTLSARLDC